MTNWKVLLKALVLLVYCFCYSSYALATDTAVPTSPTTTSPDTLDLSDGTITNPQYGCPSGTTAAHVNTSNWGTETVRFGECVNTFAITYAINQALQGTGVSIDKVHYSWRYVMCFNKPGDSCNTNLSNRVNTSTGEVTDDTYFDELQVVIEITDSSGNVVETKTWNMDTWYQWNAANSHSDNEIQVGSVYWQIEEGNIEVYNHIDKTGTIRTPNSVGDVRFRISGHDKGNWDGYYGPVINRLQTWFTYRANPCNDTALYDPSCPGYATAYAAWEYEQNCSANALYDPGCPGYATANYNAQCSADPLYDSGCPGYATAYYNQQCSADPLYDSGCDGYEAAYLSQQCNLDQTHSSQCPYYSSAIATNTPAMENKAGQGSDFIEVVSSDNSSAYNIIYYNSSEIAAGDWVALCETYTGGCEDAVIYQVSYFNSENGPYAFLYTKDKDGNTFIPTNGDKYKFMTETQFDAYCDSSSLYSPMCDGYAAAYFTQQCTANPLYNSECDGYAAAYTAQQCESNPLYATSCSGYAAAYLAQQCSISALYDSSCSGYAEAYFAYQCSANALYDENCTGYAEAYLTYQCNANVLYDESCTGYAEAFFNAQCEADATYDIRCTGYEQAYFDQQCLYNPQYDPLCIGYVAPVIETSPQDLIDDGTGTGDSIVDSVIEVPTLPVINLIPDIPQTVEVPQPEIVMPDIPEVEVVVVEVPTPVEQIELEVEAQIEQELQIETLPEVEVETVESEPQNETQEQEESGSDVEQSMDTDGTDEDSSDSGSSEEDSSTEDTEGDTEEVAEESTEDESTEDEATEEESTEEESTEEENTEEESSEEESTEEESTEEESTEEKPVVKKKTTKKLTKAQKEKAKKEKMKEIIKDKLKKLADDMGNAQTLEAQQALQQIIAALINYVPGFNAYGQLAIPGIDFYQSDEIYKDKKVPENLRGLRNGLASELLHKKMVDMQYEGME
jgi:hypothetical protein